MADKVWEWSGKTGTGEVQTGEMQAESKEAVQKELQRKNITPTLIKPKEKKGRKGGKVTDRDIVIFTRQFSTMIDAGLPLVQALEILANQSENPVMRRVLTVIKNDVEGGSTFADALKKHPATFSSLYANMVAAGEVGGILDTILQRLAAYIEKAAKLKKQIKGAMVYPITILSIAVLVVGVIMVFVVPVFQDMFSSLGGTLPLPTQIVVSVSNWLKHGGVLMLVGGFFAFMAGMKKIRSTEKGLYITDKLSLKLPVMGDLLKKVAVSKFTRTMSTLTSAGVPILEGLEITAKTAGNKVIEYAVLSVRAGVAEGKTLTEPLQKAKVFPDMVVHMISVGEQTGALDIMMTKIADFYDDEVDSAVDGMTAAMEPLMMVFLGGSVGFIIVAMYLPIFKLITLV
jgi:type IV pilus assembly protein PilC